MKKSMRIGFGAGKTNHDNPHAGYRTEDNKINANDDVILTSISFLSIL